ncbi:TadE/TadG family type IV pilus assembly protein [Rathayibacter soli]|uniref:TadE/TadG family type IV pilus assembly protein n=1 Tax=Rathayibacter soli TaxID=3144168 RepID=UPI0027E508D7|nr:hypothetical protein [Glaciibacter superstes]
MMTIHLRGTLRQLGREDGVATSAIVIPGTVLLVVIALQCALWFLGGNIAQNAAMDAYRDARAYQSTTDAGTAAAGSVLTLTGGFLDNPTVQVQRTATTVTVTVTGDAVSLIPGLSLPPVQRSITGPVERWIPAP